MLESLGGGFLVVLFDDDDNDNDNVDVDVDVDESGVDREDAAAELPDHGVLRCG